jgi:type I restriction enzyme S subunit
VSRYQAYPECKDSGVENLGTIPSNWEVMQLRRTVLDCVNGIWGNEPENDGSDTIVIRVADFDRPKLSIVSDGFTYRKIDSKEKRSRVLARGDLLLEKSGGGEKTLVGQVVLFDKDFVAVTSNFVAKMTPGPNFSSSYLNYVFCRFYSSNINYCSIKQNTGIQNLDSASYLSEKFGFPPLHEQERIADFLDHETEKIDALIEKQQRLIELLKEKRQAVISHAVTKGLNPNALMKNSGVEWLGEVPAHWGITQIKYVAELNPRRALVELKPSLECNFVPMEKLKTESLLLDEIRTVDEVISGYTCFCDEDILMAKVTPCFENKNIAVARGLKNGVGFGSTEIYVLRTVKHVSNSFLLYRLQENEFMRMATGSMTGAGGLKRVPTDFVNSFKFAIPPIPEQLDICSFIEKQKNRYDTLESLARNQVELLQERRTALISAAVTGKVDVRDWQAAA